MRPRRIAIVTGTRAEYGLLRSVMHAVDRHPQLTLEVLVTGVHLLPDRNAIDEIAGEFDIAATIPMQIPDESGRSADAAAIGRGVSGFAARFAAEKPHVVVVLGDHIEAFAAAGAAAVSGIHLAHMHGGDQHEEAMELLGWGEGKEPGQSVRARQRCDHAGVLRAATWVR